MTMRSRFGFPRPAGELATVMDQFRAGELDATECAARLLGLSGINTATGELAPIGYDKHDNHTVRARRAVALRPDIKAFRHWLVEMQGLRPATANQYALRINTLPPHVDSIPAGSTNYAQSVRALKLYHTFTRVLT